MTVHVNVSVEGISVNESFDGVDADEIVGKMKSRVARELSFPLKMAVNAMGNLMFAQEVVRRYNDVRKLTLPIPTTTDGFILLAVSNGLATMG